MVFKPSGIVSQPAKGRRDDMLSRLSSILGQEVYPIHRLDKDTAGVMVYALSEEGAKKLSNLVANNKMEKVYYGVCQGIVPQRGVMEDFLFHDKKANKTQVVKADNPQGQRAVLRFEKIAEGRYGERDISLAKIILETGRTHQIRVQFSSRGFPLVGDSKYGGEIRGNLALFATSLSFENPFSGEKESYSVPLPNKIPWNIFENAPIEE